MALAMDVSVEADTNNNAPQGHIDIGTNRALLVLGDVDDARNEAVVGDISTGSLVFGSLVTISPGGRGPAHVAKLETDKALCVLEDTTTTPDTPKARVLTVAGSVVTPQALSSAFENVNMSSIRVAASTSGLALAFYRTTVGRYCRLTIPGNSVTPGTPVNSTTSGIQPKSATRMDDDRILVMYRIPVGNGLELQVVDISSGISQGTPSSPGVTIHSSHNDGSMQLARLTDDKAVALIKPSVGAWTVRTVNLSGTTIDSFGAPLTVPGGPGGPSGGSSAAIWPITSSKFVVLNQNSSPDRPWIESFSVDGDDITADDDGGSTAADQDSLGFGITVVSDTLGIASWAESGSNNPTGARVTNIPSSNGGPGSAKFYQGAGVLTEKFTLPFSGVEPGAMTLDKTLGTVVIGANTPAGQMINFGGNPYNAFTNMTDGIPTGTATTGVKWI